jgi:hypothetical protein
VDILRNLQLRVPVISGLVSRSPLASREAEAATEVRVLGPRALAAAAVDLLSAVRAVA